MNATKTMSPVYVEIAPREINQRIVEVRYIDGRTIGHACHNRDGSVDLMIFDWWMSGHFRSIDRALKWLAIFE